MSLTEELSYCGLVCSSCPIFLAAREPDATKKHEMIEEIIRACKQFYGVDYKNGDINECDGCKANTGKLFFGCKDCKIRACAIQKEIQNCAYCNEYPCAKLEETFKNEQAAKTRLDQIRAAL
jgi:hypothetical protein